jgi:hypothetical protein
MLFTVALVKTDGSKTAEYSIFQSVRTDKLTGGKPEYIYLKKPNVVLL